MKKKTDRVDEKTTAKKKKKKSGCSPCGCIAVFTLVFVLIIGATLGVGSYFANEYMVNSFGVNIGDAFGLISEVFTVDESKIITNAPSDGDKQGFYDGISDSLLLRDGTIDEESFSAILNSFSGSSEEGTEGEVSTVRREASETPEGEMPDGENSEGETTDGEDAAQTLADILSKDNIDIEKLNAVTDDDFTVHYDDKFVLAVKDTQLMAFVNSLWAKNLEGNEDPIMTSITPAQLILSVKNGDPVIFLTVKVKLEPIIDAYLTPDMGIPDFVISTIKSMLPKDIFVSVELTLGEEATTGDIVINGMTEKGRKNMHSLLTGILKLNNAEYDSYTVINDFIAQTVTPIIATADEMLDFRNTVTDGYINFDIYGTLASTVFENMEGSDLALLYTRVMQADVEKMKEENEDKFFKTPVEQVDGTIIMSAEASEQAFLDEFSSKYLMHTNFWWDENDTSEHKKIYLEPTEEEKESLTEVNLGFNDISALFGLGESELDLQLGLELKSLLDTHALNRKIGGEQTDDRSQWYVNRPQSEIEFFLTDAMLGALIDSQLSAMLEGNEMLSDLELLFVHTNEGEEETVSADDTVDENDDGSIPIKRRTVTLGLTVKTANLFSGMDFVSGLIDEEIGVIVTVDITPELIDSALAAPTLCYCDFTVERTEQLLEVLEKAGIEFFSAEQINAQFATPVRDAITKMEQMLGGMEINTGKIHMPDVFQLLAANGFPYNESYTDVNYEPIEITGAGIHLVLQKLYNIPDIEITTVGTEEIHFLVDETTKSWTDEAAGISIIPGDAASYYGTNGSAVRTNDRENAVKMSAALTAFGTSTETTFGSNAFDKLGAVVGYHNDEESAGKMYITIEYDIASYLDDGKTDTSLLPLDTVYATFEVDKSVETTYLNKDAYPTKLVINDMTEAEQKILHDMMCYINSANRTRFTNLENAIGAFAYAVDKEELLLTV